MRNLAFAAIVIVILAVQGCASDDSRVSRLEARIDVLESATNRNTSSIENLATASQSNSASIVKLAHAIINLSR
jgi:outer membrane murein-binding lipoprotein Lpp